MELIKLAHKKEQVLSKVIWQDFMNHRVRVQKINFLFNLSALRRVLNRSILLRGILKMEF